MNTFAPAFAMTFAHSKPMPLEAPVITTFFPIKEMLSLLITSAAVDFIENIPSELMIFLSWGNKASIDNSKEVVLFSDTHVERNPEFLLKNSGVNY
jgi:hypothetical protein